MIRRMKSEVVENTGESSFGEAQVSNTFLALSRQELDDFTARAYVAEYTIEGSERCLV